jgi:hypothetical protein
MTPEPFIAADHVAQYLSVTRRQVLEMTRRAVRHKLVEYELGTRENNLKPVLACAGTTGRFLPSPRLVLQSNPEIGDNVKYVDPFTATWKILKRTIAENHKLETRGAKPRGHAV